MTLGKRIVLLLEHQVGSLAIEPKNGDGPFGVGMALCHCQKCLYLGSEAKRERGAPARLGEGACQSRFFPHEN